VYLSAIGKKSFFIPTALLRDIFFSPSWIFSVCVWNGKFLLILKISRHNFCFCFNVINDVITSRLLEIKL